MKEKFLLFDKDNIEILTQRSMIFFLNTYPKIAKKFILIFLN